MGEVMVKSVRLLIGGQEIQRFTGEWMHIYHKLTLAPEKRKQYDILIGNTPDLYDVECFHKLYEKWIVDRLDGVMHVGDAMNDAWAIESADIGVSMEHGALACRRAADVCIQKPLDLVSLWKPGGFYDQCLEGSYRLFWNLCYFCGLLEGFLLMGLFEHKLTFLGHSFLYEEVWPPALLLVVTSGHYTSSVLAYSLGGCQYKKRSATYTHGRALMGLCGGLLVGTQVGWWIRHQGYLSLNYVWASLWALDALILWSHAS